MVLFAPNRMNVDSIQFPKEAPRSTEQKTPSQRLRGVLYLVWKSTNSTLSFESYYAEKIEGFIDVMKDKLPKE